MKYAYNLFEPTWTNLKFFNQLHSNIIPRTNPYTTSSKSIRILVKKYCEEKGCTLQIVASNTTKLAGYLLSTRGVATVGYRGLLPPRGPKKLTKCQFTHRSIHKLTMMKRFHDYLALKAAAHVCITNVPTRTNEVVVPQILFL